MDDVELAMRALPEAVYFGILANVELSQPTSCEKLGLGMETFPVEC